MPRAKAPVRKASSEPEEELLARCLSYSRRRFTMVSWYASRGAFGLMVTDLAGMPTFTCQGRTSRVATAIAPTMAFSPTVVPASTVAW